MFSRSDAIASQRIQLLLAVSVVSLCCVFYARIFPPLIREWYEHENFSYGFLIPFIFLYLVWEEREAFKDHSIGPSFWGAVSFLAALLVGVVGKAVGEPFISRVSLVLVIGSLVHLFW